MPPHNIPGVARMLGLPHPLPPTDTLRTQCIMQPHPLAVTQGTRSVACTRSSPNGTPACVRARAGSSTAWA